MQKPSIPEVLAVAFLFVGVLFFLALIWIETPTVVRAYPSKKCLQVLPPSAGTCDQLPKHYHTEWHSKETSK